MWIIDKFGNKVWQPIKNARIARMMSRVFFEGEGGEGGGGGGEKTPEQIFQEKLDAAVAEKVAGLKSNNQQLLEENREAKRIKAALDKLGGEEGVSKLSEFQKKIANDEILTLHSQGKHEEATHKITERLTLEHNAEKQTLSKTLEEKDLVISSQAEQLNKLIIDGETSREFVAEKGRDTALPDVMRRVREVFKVENGQAVARNEKGELVAGESGAPLNVKEYIQGLRKTAPHLFPESEGLDLKTGADGKGLTYEQRLSEAAKKGGAELRRVEALIAEEKKKAR